MNLDMLAIEKELYGQGFQLICGVDEAGRGPLAGPVCAAAVILPPNAEIPGLNDSKKLSDKKRRELFPIIKKIALAYAIVMVDEKTIDEINILQATFRAMERSVAQLDTTPDYILVDGNKLPDLTVNAKAVVHGDSLSASIAAASVLAKVSRDDFMLEQAKIYPEYGFEIHKGYGTKAHTAAILEHGPCPIHRTTFLKKLYGTK